MNGLKDIFDKGSKTISFSIIDFLGVFLPGVVWLLVILNWFHIKMSWLTYDYAYPFGFLDASAISSIDIGNYVILTISILILSLIIGYIVEAVSTFFAWNISTIFFITYWKMVILNLRLKSFRKYYKIYKYPFDEIFMKTEYFNIINDDLKKHSIDYPNEFRPYTLFFILGGNLKLNCPILWQEVQKQEGHARMIASFFLASFLNVLINIIYYNQIMFGFPVLIMSIVVFIVLANAYLRRSMKFASCLYLNYLVYLNNKKK